MPQEQCSVAKDCAFLTPVVCGDEWYEIEQTLKKPLVTIAIGGLDHIVF